jgi:FtsH-binding integral membrane protein
LKTVFKHDNDNKRDDETEDDSEEETTMAKVYSLMLYNILFRTPFMIK